VTRIVTLACFCCDHRNPVGAKFCNACGTPLHLKPCKHCEAINVRAAAHCHGCGETFALEFAALDETGPPPDAPGAPEIPAPAGPTLGAAYSEPTRRQVVKTRAAALLLGMTAIALLSAYYAYRQPGIGPNAAANGDDSQPAGPAISTDARQEPATAPMSARTAPGPSTESPAFARSPADGPGASNPVVGAAPATPSDENAARPLFAPTPKAAATRAGPSAKRSAAASATKPKAAARVARTTRTDPVAATRREAGRQVEERPPPDPSPIALHQFTATPAVRSMVADRGPAQRPKVSASRPVPPPGSWDRPCAEGGVLDANCDVRTMPKGN
jgi:hypothetical protein